MCQNIYNQIYADDAVLYTYGNNITHISDKFTQSMVYVTTRSKQSCLQLNVYRTVAMFFTKSNNQSGETNVFVAGEMIKVMPEYKYLKLLTFKTHIKRVCNRVKPSLSNFCNIRQQLYVKAAKVFMHAMVLAHMKFCKTTLSN